MRFVLYIVAALVVLDRLQSDRAWRPDYAAVAASFLIVALASEVAK